SYFGPIQHFGCDRLYRVRELRHITRACEHIQRKTLDRATIVEEMMWRVHVCAEMHRRADARDIGMRAFIHGFDLLKLKCRVAGPGGQIRGDREGDIVDGHRELLVKFGLGELAPRTESKLSVPERTTMGLETA